MKKLRRLLSKIKLVINNPRDVKFCMNNLKKSYDIVLVIHEAKRLGASILLLNIAKELRKQGKKICIISRTFGELNDEYSKICSTHISITKKDYKKIMTQVYNNGCRNVIINTSACGDLVKISKDIGYNVLSLIHELKYVIEKLNIEDKTKEMLVYSDRIIFSTSVAEKEVLDYLNINDKNKIIIKPQGIYYEKPDDEAIKKNKKRIYEKYPNIKDQKVIIGVGNTTERKGFDIFINTAKLLPDKYFLWCGRKETYYDEILNKVKNVPNNFTYLGMLNQEELAGLYSIANVLLMSSRQDTLPSTIFEALLFNVPVVGARNSGGIIDIIDSSNGFLTKNADANEFITGINFCIENINKIDFDYERYSFNNYVHFLINELERINNDRKKRK